MRSTLIYALGGAAFGLCFPVVATLLSAYLAGGTSASSALLEAQASDPLLWIIDSAPLWLSLFASLAGRRQDRADQLNHQLKTQLRQRKQVEEILDPTSREQQAITDVIPDVLYVVNTRGRLIKWNRRLEDITGLTPDELYQRDVLSSFFLEEERAAVACAFRRIIVRDEVEVEAHFMMREGPVANGVREWVEKSQRTGRSLCAPEDVYHQQHQPRVSHPTCGHPGLCRNP